MAVDLDKLASELAPTAAEGLLAAAKRGGTEADFRREAARILEETGAPAGLTIVPRDEFSVARGRVDSVYNRLVLEYKRPGVLKSTVQAGANRAVVEQLKGYILDVATREKREADRLAGVATDGFHLVFLRRVGGGWSDPEVYPVNAASAERLLRLLFSLVSGKALIAENLVEDFGPRTIYAQRAVRALYTVLHSSKHPLVEKLFEQWRLFFSEVTDYREWAETIESKEEFRSFVRGMGLDPKYAEAPKVFFALHTYYALLIKLVASLAAARFAGGVHSPLAVLAAKEGVALRDAFVDLERGGIFREYGIRNFLEGDFFGWYLSAWDPEIEAATSGLVHRLADYDPGALELAPENARDLLKKLYHYLLPREIRHDLGEYYTPDWLAERLIIQTLGTGDLGDPTKRVLDPACGSGTFLVILIKHVRQRAAAKGQDPTATLELILQNVVGIDLNPLAVIASRTNYLLALGELMKARRGDIDLPVYQADSVLTPSRGSDLYEADTFPLKTSVGVFRVPAALAARERMDALANTLDESVAASVTEAVFLSRIAKAAHLNAEEVTTATDGLLALYRQLRRLHDGGLNGVWARIIKNAFAPLFLEPCHYVVGNPPWVNWEHLPDEYRRSTMALWDHYGLFPKRAKAMETILGSAKYDISMLMTYVAADKYLRRGGRLGFVLPQTLFKTAGAGQGFRRFMLPDGVPIGPFLVEDMVELKPFEGAANRTAVAVFGKGHAVRYPVSYSYWKKRERGRKGTIGFDTPYQEVTARKITYRAWAAEPVKAEDLTSSWVAARPRALRALRSVFGKSDYVGREGTNTGGANAVYWVQVIGQRPGGLVIVSNVTERAKKKVDRVQAAVESDLLYPMLRGSDVLRWQANPEIQVVVTHLPGQRLKAIPPEQMQATYPRTFAYLKRFESLLKARPALRRYFKADAPFYSIFNIGDYSFAPWKVVWREVASEVDAAVIGSAAISDSQKPVLPDHTCILVESSNRLEAHFICAVVNSSPVRLAIRSYIVLHPDPHVLTNVSIPDFVRKNRLHSDLAELSEAAHKATTAGKTAEVNEIERRIDQLAAGLWRLSEADLAEIRRSLEEA
jgi:SAM-dependent methyltransferase